jgi:hypothetical protein
MRYALLALGAGLASIGCGAVGPLPPPLAMAARAGDLAGMRRALDAGADPNERDERTTEWPPLMHAIHSHQIDAVKLLLDRGADPNLGTPRGYTPLMMAAAEPDPAYVQLLLARGADTRPVGPAGQTALGIALSGGALLDIDRPLFGGCHPDTVKAILAHDPALKQADVGDGPWARWWARFHHCSEVLDAMR